jgi:hypothetical protein
LKFKTVELVGTYTITGGGDATVLDATYTKGRVAPNIDRRVIFQAPPASVVACLDPAFR